MTARNTREENKENRENSGESCRQIHLHLLFGEPIILLVFLRFLWCFSVFPLLCSKHDIFIAQVIWSNLPSWNKVKTSSFLHQRSLAVVRLSLANVRLIKSRWWKLAGLTFGQLGGRSPQVSERSPEGVFSQFFTRAIVRLDFSERPAMPRVFPSIWIFWATVRPMIWERRTLDLSPWFCLLLLQDLSVFLDFSSRFPCLFSNHVYTHKTHQNTLKLEEITTIQDGKCDIWVSILLTHQTPKLKTLLVFM